VVGKEAGRLGRRVAVPLPNMKHRGRQYEPATERWKYSCLPQDLLTSLRSVKIIARSVGGEIYHVMCSHVDICQNVDITWKGVFVGDHHINAHHALLSLDQYDKRSHQL